MKNLIFILFVLLLTACNGQKSKIELGNSALWDYPPSKTVDSSNTYWGVTYYDPYRWLENLKDTTVVQWFKKQAELTNSVMNRITGRDELISEWKKLDKLQPPFYSLPRRENGRVFYQKRMPSEKVSKVYFREGINGEEKLLFDPLNYLKGKTLSVQQILPSYDGKKLIISYSEGGAEVSTVRVMNIDKEPSCPILYIHLTEQCAGLLITPHFYIYGSKQRTIWILPEG